MKYHLRSSSIIFFTCFVFSHFVSAQNVEVNEIEDLYDQFETKEVRRVEKKTSTRKFKAKRKARQQKKNANDYSLLAELEPLSDIAIIQRRFLPTAERFELSTMGVAGMNNTYFNNIGAALKGSYFFTSKYAVEVSYFGMSPSKKDFTNALEDSKIRTVAVFTKSYMGASFKWTPFYGKLSFLNDDIYNFDTYFTIGAGSTTMDDGSAATMQFGVGQVYAISKSIGFKVDLNFHMYSAKDANNNSSSQSDIFLGLGATFYFPEATYR